MNKQLKKRLKMIKWMKIRYAIACYLGFDHAKYLKKHKLLGYCGEKVTFQPNTIPNCPQLIKLHDNVKIASGVTFYEHDIINYMFKNIDGCNYKNHLSCVEIYDNCFIGGKSIIVGNVKIGPNAIVGAGSVVVKDVEPGTIVAGNPAKAIGRFEDLHDKRKAKDTIKEDFHVPNYEEIWKEFYERKK